MGRFDSRDLRRALGGFATGVTVVTSRSPSGQAVGITVNSFCSVSLEPPLVLWCLARTSPSLPVFANASHFAIHVLAADQSALSERFSRPATDKFAGLDWVDGLGRRPLLESAAARFECRREHGYQSSGDHLIVIGRIERYCYAERAPLLFHRGKNARIGRRLTCRAGPRRRTGAALPIRSIARLRRSSFAATSSAGRQGT